MKKLNEELDHIPIIIKIILCVVMTAIIALMNLLFVGVVNAQTIGYVMSNNNLQHCTLLGGDCQWTQFNNNASTSIAVTRKPTILLGLWSGVQKGSINGIYDIQISVPNGTTCNNLKGGAYVLDSTSRLDSAINYPACTISGNTASLRITFTTINPTDNNTIQLVYPIPTNNAGGTYYGVGSIDLTTIDNATSQDITQQTIDIINNAIQNSLNQSQTIINESNTLGNRIETIINSATNSLQTTLTTLHCETIDKNNIKEESKYLNDDGTISTNERYGLTDYINISNNPKIKVIQTRTGYASTCFYNVNKNVLSCIQNGNLTQNQEITIPTNTEYVRFSIEKNENKPQFAICRNSTDAILENQNQNTDRMIDKMILFHEAEEEDWEEEKGLLQSILSAIGSIFSSSIDDPSNTLNSFNNSIATDNTVSSLLLLPVRLYQNVLNNINGSCNSFTLGSLYNHNLTMTCIQPQSFLGSALYGVIDVIISGFFILHIRKKFVDIFNHLTSLRTGGNELE